MTTEIIPKQYTDVERSKPDYNQQQIDSLKKTLASDITNDEFLVFMAFCQSKGFDPFSKEIYIIKRQGRVTYQTAIDGLRAKAESSGLYDGQITEWCGKEAEWSDVWLQDTPPLAAKVSVWRKGCAKPFVGIARWSEYKPETNDFMWKKMPSNQLAKCAEALALRKAFPNNLGGIYAKEEINDANNPKPTLAMPRPRSEAPQLPVVSVSETRTDSESAEKANASLADASNEGQSDNHDEKKTKKITKSQQALFHVLWKKAKIPEHVVRAYLKNNFGTEHSIELDLSQFQAFVEWAERYQELQQDEPPPEE